MYAIVQTGGKQYICRPGTQIKVEKIKGEPGDRIKLDRVLAAQTEEGFKIGAPFIDNLTVETTLVRTARDRKVIVFKKKRRQGYKKKQGHRQWFTVLKVNSIGEPAVEEQVPVEAQEEQTAVETTEQQTQE